MYLKNQILPTLYKQTELIKSLKTSDLDITQQLVPLSMDQDNENNQVSNRLKIVKIVGMKVFNDLHTKNMSDWRVEMFNDQFIFGNICSIQDCVIHICKNEFKKKLEIILKYLVEYQGISNLLTLQYLPRDCRESLQDLFSEKLQEFMNISK